LCGYAAATMLWLNHKNCLTTLGASTAEFYREVELELRRFLKSLATKQLSALQSESPRNEPQIVRVSPSTETVLSQ